MRRKLGLRRIDMTARMNRMDWMEYTILTTTEASDLISQILMDAGSSGTMIEDRKSVV